MRRLLIFFGTLFFFIIVYALYKNRGTKISPVKNTDTTLATSVNSNMLIERINNSIKIPVSNTEMPLKKLDEISYVNLIRKLTNGRIEYYPANYHDQTFVHTRIHPMIGALHYSFAHHRPVVISPDMIWLMIMQGFSRHINFNSDKIKGEIYNYTEIKTIHVQRDDFIYRSSTNNWDEVLLEITNQIEENTNSNIHDLILPDFSTTTKNISIAYKITMMDALSDYYSYNVATACGIPYIILEGTQEDWKWIKEQLPKLKKYDLDFWVDNLQPIIDKIHETSMGHVDIKFWQSIYKWNTSSGGNKVTGWITKFFPYLETENKIVQINRSLQVDLYFNNDTIEPYIYGMGGDDFTSGMSVCDFNWNYFGENIDMQLYAGFVGINQDTNMLLKPEINWFVAQKSSKKELRSGIDETIDWDKNISIHGKEIDCISPYDRTLDTIFYEICKDPDILPIFRPSKNKTFEEGWSDFLKYLKTPSWSTIESGEAEVTFIVTSNGECFCKDSKADTDYLKDIGCAFVSDSPKWKPGMKNGKIVLVELKVTIDFYKN